MDIYVLTNARSDGSPTVAFGYDKAVLLLPLGARGGVWRVSNPTRPKTGIPFVPEVVNCWRKGQMPRPMADLLITALEAGDTGKPLVLDAPKGKKAK